ncbi:MAG: hypothetical protein KDI13_10345 [Alphaproteobacteria bacterium]|nr:hypothetical protein [Alphaproteobacteria bacterium]
MNDDLDEEVIGSDDGFDEFVQKNSLGDVWRNNPLVKVGIVIVGAGAIFGAIMIFGGGSQKPPVSAVPVGSSVNAPPGTEAASPAYVQAVEAQNEADLEEAIKTQGSTLPVPIETPSERLQLPAEEEEEEDPLHRWRRLQEERVVRETKQQVDTEPVTVVNSEQQNQAVKAMAEAMSKQMQSILGHNTKKLDFTYKAVVDPQVFETDNGTGVDGGGEDLGEELTDDEEAAIIISAGDIAYAQLLTEANSDVPGPVLALLVSGPLKGSKILGKFSVKEDKYLTLNFDTVVVDGKSVSITAIALDPDTTLPGMATEVNHRYFKRVILPAAAAFVKGLSQAIADSGNTDITISQDGTTTASTDNNKSRDQKVATGVSEAGDEISSIIDDMANDTKVLVKIHSGTPMGILFTEPVMEKNSSDDMTE